jgi:SAM-dependent methyltransferase
MDAQTWNERSYAREGFAAQRLYPNEELLRFMGRNFFGIPCEKRREISILEAGCGSGANLWMIAREGFDAHGIDYSPAAITLCREMLHHWQTTATLEVADMTAMPHAASRFDAVLDVFSSYCLDERGFDLFVSECARVLRSGGRMFSYTPSKGSDAFRNHAPAKMVDASTLDSIKREGSPYAGSDHSFRFIGLDEYRDVLQRHGFTVEHIERVGRTYRRGDEYFEWIVIEATRP